MWNVSDFASVRLSRGCSTHSMETALTAVIAIPETTSLSTPKSSSSLAKTLLLKLKRIQRPLKIYHIINIIEHNSI